MMHLLVDPMFYVCMISCVTVIGMTATAFSDWENGKLNRTADTGGGTDDWPQRDGISYATVPADPQD
jgi:hypothetical protein